MTVLHTRLPIVILTTCGRYGEQEYKIHNADLLFKEDSTVDDLIDIVEVRARLGPCSVPAS